MKHYERPAVLTTYSVEELVEEAAICMRYGSRGPSGGGSVGRGPVGRGPKVSPIMLPDTGASGLAGGGLLGSIAAGISLLAAGVYIRLRRH